MSDDMPSGRESTDMQWVCQICGYVHDDDEPPGVCPVCGAPQSKFSERYDDDDAVNGAGQEDEEQDYYGEFE